jgi:primosomal protein N' (replication factor Y)
VPVRVPLGKRTTRAYVAEVAEGPGPEGIVLRDVLRVDEDLPQLPAALVELVLFAADYYAAPPGEMLAAALPAVAKPVSARYQLTELGRQSAKATGLKTNDRAVLDVAQEFPRGFTVAAVQRKHGWNRGTSTSRLKKLVDRGWLSRSYRRKSPRGAIAYRRVDGADPEILSGRQKGARALFERIPTEGTILASVLAVEDKSAYPRLKTLEKTGLVERTVEEQRLRPLMSMPERDTPPEPTPEQATAIAAICSQIERAAFQTFLLQGVTGSGKTEVYLRIIADALARGRTALVLVPEIALTPQLGARFRARFGDQVATLHSALTLAERRDEWERVARGDAKIGLGARSAIFLPLRDLGVVVVDEEYETSFKQEEMPRYNARDLAVVRGRNENAVVVLGSATPSLETRANADQARYRRLDMPSRVHTRPLPEVQLLDLAHEERIGEGVFTLRLAEALERALRAGDQAVLFLNRRGFAPYVFCRDCGHSFRCPDCDVALTLHRRRGVLLCHYCAFEEYAPDECPECHSHKVESFGLGTERIEAEINNFFGDVTTARLDRDTVRKRADLERQLNRFGSGEARILIGTQMVAKGHDFPGVTLVGVIAADASLNFPDFRAAERTFQLLTQVAGRAGRGERPGSVLVQVYESEHYAVRAAADHDFEAFVHQELQTRRELSYPPFAHLALLRSEGQDESATQRAANDLAARLRERARQESRPVSVLGPAPAPLSRLRGMWRFQILLKGNSRSDVRAVVKAAGRPGRDVRQILDIDPYSML